VRAVDQAGNADQSPATLTWQIDLTPPAVQIDSGPGGLTNDSTPTFAFSSEPGTAFECSIDTGTPNFGPCSGPGTHTPAAPLSDGPHTFRVRATDAAGNQATATRSFEVDATAPETQITANPPALSNSPTADFSFFGSDPGGSGVASFECRRDAEDWTPCASPRSYSALAEGAHSFEVRAIDQAGNTDSSPASFTWTIETVAPSAPELSATNPVSPANDNTPEILGSAPAGTTIRLYAGADCSGPPLATVPVAALEAGIEVTVLDDSSTDFSATATTTAGNTSACSESLAYLEDSTAPGTQLGSRPAARTDRTTASFAFSGVDPGGSGVASFECRRDSSDVASWTACASPQAYSDLADGAHTFEVRAVDAAGNPDQSPAAFQWTVDTTVPPAKPEPTPPAASSDPDSPDPVRFVRVKRNTESGTALLVFSVPGPGLLSAHAPEVTLDQTQASGRTAAHARETRLRQKQITPTSIRVTQPGLVKVPIELARAGRSLLRESHRLKVKVVVSFRSADGSSATWKMTVTLKKRTPQAKTTRRTG
jgi:hypothetical protein